MLWNKPRKELTYEVLSNTNLVDSSAKDVLQIVYKGVPVVAARLLILNIINSGKVPISDSDCSQPVTISFVENATVLNADITHKFPENVEVVAHPQQNMVSDGCPRLHESTQFQNNRNHHIRRMMKSFS